jgi:hypothetical protein
MNAAYYRNRAHHIRWQAWSASAPVRPQFLEIAAQYERLAETVEGLASWQPFKSGQGTDASIRRHRNPAAYER